MNVAVRVIYEVLSGEATLWRAVLGRFRVGALAVRSLLVSDGCVSAGGVLASPTSSRRNLNLDRKSCQTTYQPEGVERGEHNKGTLKTRGAQVPFVPLMYQRYTEGSVFF